MTSSVYSDVATSFSHPDHPISDEVGDRIRALHDDELARVARQHDVAKQARPTDEERLAFAEIYGTAGSASRSDLMERQTQLRDLRKKYATRVQLPELLMDDAVVGIDDFPDWILVAPVDSSFWWAHTDPFGAAGFGSHWREDGLIFTGNLHYDDQDLLSFSFGAEAWFELHYDRLPPGERWRSAPAVQVDGRIGAYTGWGDIFQGDCWAKLWMHRSQTLFQYSFGGPERVVGYAEETENIIFEENAQRYVEPRLRGFQPMPATDFWNLSGGVSIWARLIVRFDVQIEGDSQLSTNPEIRLQTNQWKATAV